ncbi:MAG: hypothetical protein IPO21_13255, partial [Bacteroidales bacterium]|nr:hypothetical protein [Bacteroidales bacterium]
INGITISATGLIDPTHNLSNGTFTNGSNNGKYLVIANNQTIQSPDYIENVNFPSNPGGSLAKNVEKTLNNGIIEFYEATGAFAGATYEKDDYNRVNWLGIVTLTWNGSVSTDWNVAANWTASFGPNIVPTGNENVIIANVTNKPKITGSGQKTRNLTINNGARLTIESDLNAGLSDLEITGDFTVIGTGKMEIISLNDFVTVHGNWNVPSTATLVNDGTVSFIGNGSMRTISSINNPFYNLNIEGTTVYNLASDITVDNDINIISGASFDASVNNYTATIFGNWNNDGVFVQRYGTVTFSASSGTKTIDNGSSVFYNLNIAAPSVTYNLSNVLSVYGNMTLTAGIFNQNFHNVNFGDGVGSDLLIVSGSGTYNIGANGYLRMANNSTVSVANGGIFRAVGSDASNRAIITNQSIGTYAFEVENLGVFGAQFYHFEHMNTSGIYLKTGALLEGTNNFSNGIFSNGTVGGTYIRLDNTLPSHPSDEVIDNVVFNAGPTYNVTRTVGTTVAEFKDATGVMGVYDFENDAIMPADPATGLIVWSSYNSALWTGNGFDNNWHNSANWLCSCIPDETKNVTIGASAFNPIISDADAIAKKISIESGATLTINNRNLTIEEEIWFAGSLVAIGNPNITVKGNWTNSSGSFTPANSTVILAAASGSNVISPGNFRFYSLEINTTGSYSADAIIDVDNNLTIRSGILNLSLFHTYVKGNWINIGGQFIQGSRTIYFNGTQNNTIQAGASSFYTVVKSGTGTSTLSGNLNITYRYLQSAGNLDLSPDGGTTSYNLSSANRITISAGTLYGRNGVITVGENWLVNGSGRFDPGTSTLIMSSNSGTKSITTRSQPFYNLFITGASTFNLYGVGTIRGNLSITAGKLSVTSSNYAINIGGNWINNGTFLQYSGIVTFNGASQQTISGSTTTNFYRFVLNNTSTQGVVLSSPVVLRNSLSLLDGVMHTSSINLLTLNDNVTSSQGSDITFISGPMKKIGNDAFVFPVGRDSIWAPLAITAPSTTTSAFTAEYFFSPNSNAALPCINCEPEIQHVSIKEYWNIDRNVGTSNPNVTMYFKNMTRSKIFDVDDLIFGHWNGLTWEQMGTNTAVADGANTCYLVGTGFTTYSPVIPASKNGINPLPVELVNFEASSDNHNVLLRWQTASELNNDYFVLERSTDGLFFIQLGQISGAGTTSTQQFYSYSDAGVSAGTYYYRLKQTDYDGTEKYSKVIAVTIVEDDSISFEVWPVPSTQNDCNIHFFGSNMQNVTVKLIDASAKTVFNEEFNLDYGYLNLNIAPYLSLKTGTYTISIETNTRTICSKQIVISN